MGTRSFQTPSPCRTGMGDRSLSNLWLFIWGNSGWKRLIWLNYLDRRALDAIAREAGLPSLKASGRAGHTNTA
ncbi:MAG TPA: hypothetical protein VNP04_32455 [Alphaproteobacteria bacterium]|nr:hypothetical protein [Alphaproteobacteria bacterium]